VLEFAEVIAPRHYLYNIDKIMVGQVIPLRFTTPADDQESSAALRCLTIRAGVTAHSG
jgi:dihydroorotase